jgi:hypothetical protein
VCGPIVNDWYYNGCKLNNEDIKHIKKLAEIFNEDKLNSAIHYYMMIKD